MTWFKVDDGFYDHPKVLGLDMAARGLWVSAGAYCARHLTDGVITGRQIRAIGGTLKQADKLVAAGLWSADGASANARRYVFNDWRDFQPTRDDVTRRRNEDAERKRNARVKRLAKQGKVENVRVDVRADVRPDSVDPVRAESALPDPTRPDPTRPTTSNEVVTEHTSEKSEGASRGKNRPVPKGWKPKPATIAKMRAERPDLNLEAEHENFMDYWQSITGVKSRKADWDRTWLVWMRRQKRAGPAVRKPNTAEAWGGTSTTAPVIEGEVVPDHEWKSKGEIPW